MKTAWVRNLHFRFAISMYRIGEIAETLVLILMWTAIYSNGSELIKGFTLNEMITYVLIGNLCAVAVRNFIPALVSRDINEGKLSFFLVKPISYIRYIFVNEIGRTALIIAMSVVSQFIVIVFFLNKIIVNSDIRYIVLILVMLLLAFIIELLIGFLIGTISFWSDEVDGLQVSIDRIKRFFSGGYFPLSILPIGLAVASTYLPFAYSFFIPAQLYLKKITLYQGLIGLAIQLGWIAALSIIVYIVWKRGLRRYEATGA